MSSDSGKFRHITELHKWSEEQTAEVARHHGVDPDDLTHQHFESLGLSAQETLRIDHTNGTVAHTVTDRHEGSVSFYDIDDWNSQIQGGP